MSLAKIIPPITYLYLFALIALGLIGWVMNIVKIIQSGFVLAQWGGLEVARVVGIFFAPLGGALGWV